MTLMPKQGQAHCLHEACRALTVGQRWDILAGPWPSNSLQPWVRHSVAPGGSRKAAAEGTWLQQGNHGTASQPCKQSAAVQHMLATGPLTFVTH